MRREVAYWMHESLSCCPISSSTNGRLSSAEPSSPLIKSSEAVESLSAGCSPSAYVQAVIGGAEAVRDARDTRKCRRKPAQGLEQSGIALNLPVETSYDVIIGQL